MPELEVSPQDYLRFAERELDELAGADAAGAVRLRINCLGHLKRAVDSQVATFLHVFGLHKAWKRRGLKMEKKLEFLAAVGIISTRTLARMNSLRNAVEHRFESPDSLDLDCLSDLATAFVTVLQLAMISGGNKDCTWSIGWRESETGSVQLVYEEEGPRIRAILSFSGQQEELEASADSHEEFAFFFKALYLLQNLDTFPSRGYLAELLRWHPSESR